MDLFFRKLGKGKPLIILHGLLGLSDNWLPLGKSLSENYEVILVDLRNHGQSPHSFNFSYTFMCLDLGDLYKRLDIKDAILLGHSMGGKVAMKFALDHPSLVEELIVVDISPGPSPTQYVDILKSMLNVDFSKYKSLKDVESCLEKTIEGKQLRQLVMKNIQRQDKTRLAWKSGIEEISANLSEIFIEIMGDTPFPKPTLFVKGSNSNYITESDLTIIKNSFPNYELNTIKDAGHWVQVDAPVAFLKVVNAFLNTA